MPTVEIERSRRKSAVASYRRKNFIHTRLREMGSEAHIIASRLLGAFVPGVSPPMHGRLFAKVFRGDSGRPKNWTVERIIGDGVIFRTPTDLVYRSARELHDYGIGRVDDYGLLGSHLIVTAGKNYLAGAFPNTNEAENIKYHGFGTGTNAAAAGDTGLQTEFTTEYLVDNTRPTGSQSTTLAVYTTVGTFAPNGGTTLAVTEWGLFSAASSTTLWDRQVFSAINLVVANSDTLATTYALTIA